MGAIKDLVGLVTQLTGSEKDRKFATELKEIQGTLESIQSENAELKNKKRVFATRNNCAPPGHNKP